MSNETAIVKHSEMPVLTFADIKKYFCEKATEKEASLFIEICKSTGLNPFKREAYLTKYADNMPATIITGYEVYLKRAERSGKWNGYRVWTEGTGTEMKALIEVYRKDWDKPFVHEIYYTEYVQTTKEGKPNKFWREKPRTMLKKVAIAQGMRLAFPDELGGLPYTREEITDGAEQAQFEVLDTTASDVSTGGGEAKTKEKPKKETKTTEKKTTSNPKTPTKDDVVASIKGAQNHLQLLALWKTEYGKDADISSAFTARKEELTQKLHDFYVDTIMAVERSQKDELLNEIQNQKYLKTDNKRILVDLLGKRIFENEPLEGEPPY